jgi:hypothetical protein
MYIKILLLCKYDIDVLPHTYWSFQLLSSRMLNSDSHKPTFSPSQLTHMDSSSCINLCTEHIHRAIETTLKPRLDPVQRTDTNIPLTERRKNPRFSYPSRKGCRVNLGLSTLFRQRPFKSPLYELIHTIFMPDCISFLCCEGKRV